MLQGNKEEVKRSKLTENYPSLEISLQAKWESMSLKKLKRRVSPVYFGIKGISIFLYLIYNLLVFFKLSKFF